jgi:CRP/FNR family transcriptional regulator
MDDGSVHAWPGGATEPTGASDDAPWTPPLQRLLGESLAEWGPAGVAPFARLRVGEQQTLFHQGAPARCVYLVHTGWFKIVRTGEDGYEQALDFCGPGDVLGCDVMADAMHHNQAVALETAWVYALPIADVQRMCHRSAPFNARWQAAMAAHIARAGEAAWVMAAVGAEKRTARFIITFARRMGALGQSRRRLRLRMCRRDIASHLALAHESVSRSFSLLVNNGILRVENREIEILDEVALQRFAQVTRGYPYPLAGKERVRAAATKAMQPALAAA